MEAIDEMVIFSCQRKDEFLFENRERFICENDEGLEIPCDTIISIALPS